MSSNISNIKIIYNENFRIKNSIYAELQEDLDGQYPEVSIFDNNWADKQDSDNKYIYVRYINWCGECSGCFFDIFKKEVLTQFEGVADLILTWEGGNRITGLRIKNGKVEEREVIYQLGDKLK